MRAHLGQAEVAGLVAARLGALPTRSRQLVEAMACLGGRAEVSVLRAATGMPVTVMEQALAPALDEGVLVAEPGAQEAVRFRHDRVREVVLAGLDPARRRAVQLAMARRLAAVPELFAVAAEQYLPVAEQVEDAAERRQVAGLLRRAAAQAALTGDYALVDALLAAALPLISPDETAALIEVRTARHAALYGLGRLEQADEEYRALEELCPAVLDRADATVVQVRSLAHRNRLAEAFGLALASLRELGVTVPAADRLAAEAGPAVRLPVPVAGRDRRRRGPGPAGGHRPDAAGRVPTDRRGRWRRPTRRVIPPCPPGWAWKRCGSGSSRARALPCSARRRNAAIGRYGRCVGTTPPGTGRCGGSWRWARPAATSPAPPRHATGSLSWRAGSSRSKTPSRQASRPGRG